MYVIKTNAGNIFPVEQVAYRVAETTNGYKYRKMATIPDIVAIKINEDHGIDLHSQTFMNDRDKVKKLRYILQTEYPDLLVNT